MSTFEQIRDIVAETLGVSADSVTMDSSFIDDLGADSLDIVQFINTVEETYDFNIPDEDSEKMKTVEDVVNYIDQHKKE